jgi:hypothetical protein
MALLADNALDRAEQLLALTERLTHLVQLETDLIRARAPGPATEHAEEQARLTNLYRQEMSRIAQNKQLLEGLPSSVTAKLRAKTATLQDALATHALEVSALKQLSEGLFQAMAEEVSRTKSGPAGYNAGGGYRAASAAPVAIAVNRSA